MAKVFIDVGHGGKDPGAVFGNLIEKDMNLVCALACKEFLERYGVEVKLSREKDVYLSLTERASMANQWGTDLFVGCHFNAGGGDRGEVIHSVYAGKGQALAEAISARLTELGQQEVRIYSKTATCGKGDYHTVIAKTNMPAVIVEPCFIDSADRELADTREEQEQIGVCVAEGILDFCGIQYEEVAHMGQTVMKLDNVYVQEIFPADFKILQCDCKKNNAAAANYFNLGFFTTLADGTTYPVGNLAIDGHVISQTKNSPDWINLSGKKLTTIYTTKAGECGLIQTDELRTIEGLKMAVSGIPIIVGGKQVKLDQIKEEGYFGSELYDTWHGFLGLRHGKLCYVATKCDFGQMCWVLVALGIYDAIKLDGGGSFILHNGKTIAATNENRRIHNVGTWTL